MWTAVERFCGDDRAQTYLKRDIISPSNALLLQQEEHKRFGEFSIGFEAVSCIPFVARYFSDAHILSRLLSLMNIRSSRFVHWQGKIMMGAS